MSGPAFTAVIPAYNAEATLRSAVESVLEQTRGDLELVIVDDGSTDGTLALARELAAGDRRADVVHQENRGLAGARNTGIARSSAPLIGLLDSDDLWMPDFLERMGEALRSDPDAGFAYTDGWVLDEETRRIRRASVMARQRPPAHPPRDSEAFLRELITRNFIPAEGTIRREALERVGVYNESLPAVEDYELWLRLLANGYRAVRTPGNLFVRREVATSMSKDLRVMFESHLEVMRLVIEEHPASDAVKEMARTRAEALRRELASLDGGHSIRSRLGSLRLALGSARRRLLGRRLWYQEPPEEVAAAFPDLWAV